MRAGTMIGYGVTSIFLAAVGATAVSGIAPAAFAFGDEGSAGLQAHARRQANYLTSGAGTGQAQAMRTLAGNYNLKLAFAASGAARHPAYFKVAIQDDRGSTIIDTMSDGPLFYARVPDGLYRVVIESEGQTLIQIVNLQSGRKANVRIFWPSTQLSPVQGMRG